MVKCKKELANAFYELVIVNL